MKIQRNTKYKIEAIGQLIIKKPSMKTNIEPCYELRYLKETNCYIDDLRYTQLVKDCFSFAIEGKFKSLSMKRNKNQQILKQISHIKFSQLRVLQLNTNRIHDIQALEWLDAINLRCLDLEENLISTCKPLAKFYTLSLSELKIGKNLFFDTQNFERMRFKTNEYSRDFSIKDTGDKRLYNKIQFSVSFLAKLEQPKNLHQQWIGISMCELLYSEQVKKCIKRKNTKQRSLELSIQSHNSNSMARKARYFRSDNIIDLD